MQEALRYPADDTYATTIVVLIIIAAAVFAALALIALALPERKQPHPKSDTQAVGDTDEIASVENIGQFPADSP